uniref:DNA2/NAM7 helicase-like C-terminal domain-containing protein n=1 Tax=Mucochytrium quahogii TaxID=96639 RepID=A0A7S2RIV4_9STRA|mmetsp:Transcript_15774/g.34080  ORF Transcript_15774/g.34080 Transcript_15774/m.34080 type:complete len:1279 (+) Transcript_15774:23-3859(+)
MMAKRKAISKKASSSSSARATTRSGDADRNAKTDKVSKTGRRTRSRSNMSTESLKAESTSIDADATVKNDNGSSTGRRTRSRSNMSTGSAKSDEGAENGRVTTRSGDSTRESKEVARTGRRTRSRSNMSTESGTSEQEGGSKKRGRPTSNGRNSITVGNGNPPTSEKTTEPLVGNKDANAHKRRRYHPSSEGDLEELCKTVRENPEVEVEKVECIEQLVLGSLWMKFSKRELDESKLVLLIQLIATSKLGVQDYMLECMSLSAEDGTFGRFIASVISVLVSATSESTVFIGCVNLILGCLRRFDCKPIRIACYDLVSHHLWHLVSPGRLEKEFTLSEVLAHQWSLKKASGSPSLAVGDFWNCMFKSLCGGEKDVIIAGLKLILCCLQSTVMRQFLVLLLEDTNILSRCRISTSDDTVLEFIDQCEQALFCGAQSNDDTRQHCVSRVRLLQRVALRHFEEELKDLALMSVGQAFDAVKNDFFRNRQVELPSMIKLCKLLGIHDSDAKSQLKPFCKLDEDSELKLLQQIVKLYHRKFDSYSSLTTTAMNYDGWVDLAVDELRGFESIRELRNHAETKLLNLGDMGGSRLQYLSVDECIHNQLCLLREQTKYTHLLDIENGVSALKPNVGTEITFTSWSRMSTPARLESRKFLACDFGQTPTPVLGEWASLQLSKLPVVVVELDTKDGAIVFKSYYVGIVKSLDVLNGMVGLEWCGSRFPVSKSSQYVVVRKNTENSRSHKLGVAIIDGSRELDLADIIPRSLQHVWLGHANAAQRKAGCGLALVHSTSTRDISEEFFQRVFLEESIEPGKGRMLVVAESDEAVYNILQYLDTQTAMRSTRLRNVDLNHRVGFCLSRRLEILSQVEELAQGLGVKSGGNLSCETAMHFFKLYILPELQKYTSDPAVAVFPFAFFFGGRDDKKSANEREIGVIRTMFEELSTYRMFELVQVHRARVEYVLHHHTQVLVATHGDIADFLQGDENNRISVERLVLLESDRITDADVLPTFLSVENVKDCVLVGDTAAVYPARKGFWLSVFDRMRRLGFSTGEEQVDLSSSPWDTLEFQVKSFRKRVASSALFQKSQTWNNPGFRHTCQFVDVPPGGEDIGDYRSLAEAEYVVATFQYMILQGYSPSDISIVTLFQAQKLLIIDILHARCRALNLPFPSRISTYDEFIGQTSRYVLVSLVRSQSHSSDPRRDMLGLTCASHGLYVFGSRSLYCENPVWGPLMKLWGATRLELRLNEHFGCDSQGGEVVAYRANTLKDLGVVVAYMLYDRCKQFVV